MPKDVSIYNGITKKGRPTHLVSVICTVENVDEIIDTIMLRNWNIGNSNF